jgi:t-SNARE complex subunit (syntaxin)
MMRDRLTNDFSDVLRNFQVIQRTAAQKEKESVIRARAASRHSDDRDPSTLIDLEQGSASMNQQQKQSQIQMEEEVDLEELRDREKSIRKIESDIVDVNQIFKDLATMIHAQGEVIDSIESNVETATIQVSEGATQITKARDYQVS